MTIKDITYNFLNRLDLKIKTDFVTPNRKEPSFRFGDCIVYLYVEYLDYYIVRAEYPLLVVLLDSDSTTSEIKNYFSFFGCNELSCTLLLEYCFDRAGFPKTYPKIKTIIAHPSHGAVGFPSGRFLPGFHNNLYN
jgi:hypothetical protein